VVRGLWDLIYDYQGKRVWREGLKVKGEFHEGGVEERKFLPHRVIEL
jgi:hypothetical protein